MLSTKTASFQLLFIHRKKDKLEMILILILHNQVLNITKCIWFKKDEYNIDNIDTISVSTLALIAGDIIGEQNDIYFSNDERMECTSEKMGDTMYSRCQ